MSIYQLKIKLLRTQPLIWRRILIPADRTFFDLHVAIQDAMGWTDTHLHHFLTGDPSTPFNFYKRIAYPVPDDMDIIDERDVKLTDRFRQPKDTLWYEYDFGDGWMHEIVLERTVLRDSKGGYPVLLDGARACPPEDCGGPTGYAHLIRVLANPKNEEHKDMLEWLGLEDARDFDPEEFDKDAIKFTDTDRRLREYMEGFGV